MGILSSKDLDAKQLASKPSDKKSKSSNDEQAVVQKVQAVKYKLPSAPDKGESRCFFYHKKEETYLDLVDGCFIPKNDEETEKAKSAGMILVEGIYEIEVSKEEKPAPADIKSWIFLHPDASEDQKINATYKVPIDDEKFIEVEIVDNVVKTNDIKVADYLTAEKFILLRTES